MNWVGPQTIGTMSHLGQVFDRTYLQSLAGIRKREQLQQVLSHYEEAIKTAAMDGKSSYLAANIQYIPYHTNYRKGQQQPLPPPTTEEIIEAFQNKYPGCDVTYKEEWVDTDSNTRVLKKGIMIDWS